MERFEGPGVKLNDTALGNSCRTSSTDAESGILLIYKCVNMKSESGRSLGESQLRAPPLVPPLLPLTRFEHSSTAIDRLPTDLPLISCNTSVATSSEANSTNACLNSEKNEAAKCVIYAMCNWPLISNQPVRSTDIEWPSLRAPAKFQLPTSICYAITNAVPTI